LAKQLLRTKQAVLEIYLGEVEEVIQGDIPYNFDAEDVLADMLEQIPEKAWEEFEDMPEKEINRIGLPLAAEVENEIKDTACRWQAEYNEFIEKKKGDLE